MQLDSSGERVGQPRQGQGTRRAGKQEAAGRRSASTAALMASVNAGALCTSSRITACGRPATKPSGSLSTAAHGHRIERKVVRRVQLTCAIFCTSVLFPDVPCPLKENDRRIVQGIENSLGQVSVDHHLEIYHHLAGNQPDNG